jgi:hypothetical protein
MEMRQEMAFTPEFFRGMFVEGSLHEHTNQESPPELQGRARINFKIVHAKYAPKAP